MYLSSTFDDDVIGWCSYDNNIIKFNIRKGENKKKHTHTLLYDNKQRNNDRSRIYIINKHYAVGIIKEEERNGRIPTRFVCVMPSALTRSTSRIPPPILICVYIGYVRRYRGYIYIWLMTVSSVYIIFFETAVASGWR